MLRYPYIITSEENGTVLVTVAGIPGAFTACRSEAEARDMALDVTLTMLAAMMEDGEDIPPAPPSLLRGGRASRGRGTDHFVELPAMAEVKLAIYQAMRVQSVSQVRLASILGTDPKSVRRLLDLFHVSRWDHLEMALEALGYQTRVTLEPFTPAPGTRRCGPQHPV
jgi:antitoxin HicB